MVANQQPGMNYSVINTAVSKPQRMQTVTIANDMTVYQTSIWIWTLGYNNGWLEAECYSKRFQENDINGNMLPKLSLQTLEQILGIKKPIHCMTIKSAIDYLFPNHKQEQSKAPIEIGFGEKRAGSVVSNEDLVSLNSEMCTPSSVDGMSESGISTNSSLSEDSLMNNTIHFGGRRSSSKNLVRFKLLKTLKVRVGVSLKDRKIGVLKKNDTVTVSQVDGRRAFVICKDKAPAISGWISLHSETGSPYLELLD